MRGCAVRLSGEGLVGELLANCRREARVWFYSAAAVERFEPAARCRPVYTFHLQSLVTPM